MAVVKLGNFVNIPTILNKLTELEKLKMLLLTKK